MVDVLITNNRDVQEISFSLPTCRLTNFLGPKVYRSIVDLLQQYGDIGMKIEISVSPRIIQTKLNF